MTLGFAAAALALIVLSIAAGRWIATRLAPAKSSKVGSVQMIDPKSLLFSLPSITTSLPEVDSVRLADSPGSAGAIHEDAWRQQELRPAALRVDTSAEVDAAKSFATAHRVHLGYSEMFLRKDNEHPFSNVLITPVDLARLAGGFTLGELFLVGGGQTSRVRGGFIVDFPGIGYIYGVAGAGAVTALGLAVIGPAPHKADLTPLLSITRALTLDLVDWNALELVDATNEESLRAWLERQGLSEAAT